MKSESHFSNYKFDHSLNVIFCVPIKSGCANIYLYEFLERFWLTVFAKLFYDVVLLFLQFVNSFWRTTHRSLSREIQNQIDPKRLIAT